jgi:hypothetical protein
MHLDLSEVTPEMMACVRWLANQPGAEANEFLLCHLDVVPDCLLYGLIDRNGGVGQWALTGRGRLVLRQWGQEQPACPVSTEPQDPTDTIPYTSLLCATDLGRMLRDRGYSRATANAVGNFLRRHRESCPDSYISQDRDDRRRNESRYMYRPEVWPALVQHFSPPRKRRLADGI